MIIKASPIANLTDARYFAAREVQYLCYQLEEDAPSYLDPMFMKAIREWVEGPQTVGVFFHTPARTVQEAAAFYALDALEIGAARYGEHLHNLSEWPIILRMDIPAANWPDFMEKNREQVRFFQIEIHADNRNDLLPVLPDLCRHFPVLLDIQLPASDLLTLVRALSPTGICLSGSEEEAVGVKTFDELEAVFDALEG
jgi:phosphoribosylanthranilate isomerase